MSRAEVSPEEMMNVAKSVAKGEGIQNQNTGNDQGYGDNSGYGSYNESGGGYSSGQDQYVRGSNQQSYSETPQHQQQHQQQQQQYQVSEPYENEQQSTYADGSDTNNNNMTSNLPANGGGQFTSYSTPQDCQDSSSNMQGAQGGQGMQAPGRGFGNGFDEGFGQGLAGGPDGSQPHPGVQVTEQSEPGYESRDTDLHTTGSARGGGYETHQHHRDTFETKSVIQGS